MTSVSDIKNISKDCNDNAEKINDDEYLKKMLSTYSDIELPSDFDVWTIQAQCDWIRQNVPEMYENTPETLQYIVPAFVRAVDFKRLQEQLPEWMDIDKYRRGQKFVRDNYGSIIMSILCGFIYDLTFEDGLKPMIISGDLNTPYLGFKRFLSSILRTLSWMGGEPWVKGTKAHLNMQITRMKHESITKKILKMSDEQIKAAIHIEDRLCLEPESFLKDFTLGCPFGQLKKRPYKLSFLLKSKSIDIAISNAAMSIGQGNFLVLPILYPHNIGIHNVTEEDLEAYCHMWRCYGYFLGVDDEYNFCRGNLSEIKQRLWDMKEKWIAANFTDITPEWMHIVRCLIESLNYFPWVYMPHKTMILIFIEALNLRMPSLYASLNYREWIIYKVFTFTFHYGLKFSFVRATTNRLLQKIIETASNFGPQKLTKLHEKSKQYLLDPSNKS